MTDPYSARALRAERSRNHVYVFVSGGARFGQAGIYADTAQRDADKVRVTAERRLCYGVLNRIHKTSGIAAVTTEGMVGAGATAARWAGNNHVRTFQVLLNVESYGGEAARVRREMILDTILELKRTEVKVLAIILPGGDGEFTELMQFSGIDFMVVEPETARRTA